MKHNNTSSCTFLCKTLLVLLLLSSCSIKKQYYAYESEQKDEEGRPLQYYTLEHQSGREFETDIIRFSDLMTYNIFVLIETGEDYTFLLGVSIQVPQENLIIKHLHLIYLNKPSLKNYIGSMLKKQYLDIKMMLSSVEKS